MSMYPTGRAARSGRPFRPLSAVSCRAAALVSTGAIAVSAGILAGCASGSLLGGTSDALFDEPPYYAGTATIGDQPIAHLPIGYQRGATQPATFDPSDRPDSPAARLLADMNVVLDSLGASVRVEAATPVTGRPPDVQFGCEMDMHDDCQRAPGRRDKRLGVLPPSRSWVQSAAEAAAHVGAAHLLVITLETGNILPHQRNLRGDKEIQLGTDYSLDAPWLTAIDRPASTLQITGALVDAEGRVVRMGAEGLVARRTNLLVGSLGAQALISDEDVERARTARREDLPGRPLVWQVALRHMVAQLTGR